MEKTTVEVECVTALVDMIVLKGQKIFVLNGVAIGADEGTTTTTAPPVVASHALATATRRQSAEDEARVQSALADAITLLRGASEPLSTSDIVKTLNMPKTNRPFLHTALSRASDRKIVVSFKKPGINKRYWKLNEEHVS